MKVIAIAPRIDKIMIDRDEAHKINRFTGFDYGERSGHRKARPASSPEFTVTIVDTDGNSMEHSATIVANNVPTQGNVKPGEAVAIATVDISGDEWLMLLTSGTDDVQPSDVLIRYEGEPEELFERIHLFETE